MIFILCFPGIVNSIVRGGGAYYIDGKGKNLKARRKTKEGILFMAQQIKRKRVSRQTTLRSNVILAVFAAVALLIAGRLVYLQIFSYDYYKEKVMNEITVETKVNPQRGTIYDTNNNILASNATVYLCFISPQDIIEAMEDDEDDSSEDKEKKELSWTASDGTVYKNVEMDELISRFMADTLGVDYNDVMDKAAKKGRRYEEIADEISEENAEKIRKFIEEYDLSTQIYLRAGAIRYYPYGDLCSHVLGFTNSDGVGVYGLESYYNNLLEGTGGRYVTAQDAFSNDMDFKYETYIDAENGMNIVTGIDTYIQYELENQVEATLRENQAANRATGIAMNVNTGEILGMATAPAFDCNDPYQLDDLSQAKLAEYADSEEREEDARASAEKKFKEDNKKLNEESDEYKTSFDAYYRENHNEYYKQAYTDQFFTLLYQMWKNKAITELYEPGSTSKIITTAMVFSEGVVKETDNFTCTGALKIDGYPKPIHCHKTTGHGTVTYRRGLQQSCNPTLMQAAFKLGREKFYNYFLDFGYGDITGIDLPGEVRTVYHRYEDFTNVSLAVYSFGQTYKTTPIQQLCAISSIANGGKIVTPHVLREVRDGDGNVVSGYETDVKRQVISTEICDQISGILEEGVATDGGAKNARVKGYKVAAKTGTSEKIDTKDESGQTFLRVGSCVAYAPADDPEIAVIILVDEPMGGSVYGSVVAAPYVSAFLSNVLPYLGYEPQYSDDELGTVELSIRDYTGFDLDSAKIDIANRGLRAMVVGNGDTVTSQVPQAGSTVTKDGGKIILYTGGESPKATVEVPDVIGKSAEAANRLLTNAGLNVSITGTTQSSDATVASQTVAAGESVPEGTVVQISMRVTSNVADD